MSGPIPSRAGRALACLLVAAGLAGCGSDGSAPDPPQAPSVLPEGRLPTVFDPGQFGYSGPGRDRILDEIVLSGADTVRLLLSWSAVAPEDRPEGFEPADPADPGYDFEVYDEFLAAAEERNLGLLITIGGPAPAWASNGGAPGVDPDPEQFGQFAEAVATRYSGEFESDGEGLPTADMWSVWNEPNLSIFLTPQFRDGEPYAPLLYRRLYLAAQRAIAEVDPGAPLLVGETAPTGSTDSVPPIPFTRGVLCLAPYAADEPTCDTARIDAVGWAAHPYAVVGQAPWEPPPTRKFVTIDSLAVLEGVLDQGAEIGQVDAGLPVFITEYGVQSEPDPLIGVPLETQADYLGIAEQFAYADQRVRSWAQYLMRDDPPVDGPPEQAYAGFESGLQTADGTRKPAYDAFRLPLAVRRTGKDVEIWGLVRPSAGATQAEVWVQDGGRARLLRRVTTEEDGTFEIPSKWKEGRVWQLRWAGEGDEELRGALVRAYAYPDPSS